MGIVCLCDFSSMISETIDKGWDNNNNNKNAECSDFDTGHKIRNEAEFPHRTEVIKTWPGQVWHTSGGWQSSFKQLPMRPPVTYSQCRSIGINSVVVLSR